MVKNLKIILIIYFLFVAFYVPVFAEDFKASKMLAPRLTLVSDQETILRTMILNSIIDLAENKKNLAGISELDLANKIKVFAGNNNLKQEISLVLRGIKPMFAFGLDPLDIEAQRIWGEIADFGVVMPELAILRFEDGKAALCNKKMIKKIIEDNDDFYESFGDTTDWKTIVYNVNQAGMIGELLGYGTQRNSQSTPYVFYLLNNQGEDVLTFRVKAQEIKLLADKYVAGLSQITGKQADYLVARDINAREQTNIDIALRFLERSGRITALEKNKTTVTIIPDSFCQQRGWENFVAEKSAFQFFIRESVLEHQDLLLEALLLQTGDQLKKENYQEQYHPGDMIINQGKGVFNNAVGLWMRVAESNGWGVLVNTSTGSKITRAGEIIRQLNLVHRTLYLPSLAEDGKSLKITTLKTATNGKAKNRNTVHFSINHPVSTADGGFSGNWNNMPYTLVIPAWATPKAQIERFVYGDTMFRGDVRIPTNAFLLIPKGTKLPAGYGFDNSGNSMINIIEIDRSLDLSGEGKNAWTEKIEETLQQLGVKNNQTQSLIDEFLELETFSVNNGSWYNDYEQVFTANLHDIIIDSMMNEIYLKTRENQEKYHLKRVSDFVHSTSLDLVLLRIFELINEESLPANLKIELQDFLHQELLLNDEKLIKDFYDEKLSKHFYDIKDDFNGARKSLFREIAASLIKKSLNNIFKEMKTENIDLKTIFNRRINSLKEVLPKDHDTKWFNPNRIFKAAISEADSFEKYLRQELDISLISGSSETIKPAQASDFFPYNFISSAI